MSHAADVPVERASSPPTSGPGIVAIVIAAVSASILWAMVAFQILFVAPRCAKIFDDFRLKLPLVTEWVIRDAWWLAPVFLIGVLALCVSARTRWAGIVLLVIVPIILNLIMGAGLYFPYIALMEGL